jgi:hypothetical protein
VLVETKPGTTSTVQPNVIIIGTTGYSSCGVSRTTFTLTYTFRLLNAANRSAYATLGFYFNSTQLASNRYYAPAWFDQFKTEQLNESGPCPGPGSTFPIVLLSVSPA